MMWASIDPGKHKCGIAYWGESRLVNVDWLPAGVIGNLGGVYPTVVVEMPQLRGRMSRERPKDQMDLAFAAGRASAIGRTVVPYYSITWKGTQSKEKSHKLIRDELNPDERKLVERMEDKAKEHVMDAIGVGLYHLAVTGWRPKCSM